MAKESKSAQDSAPIYKKWWFWIIIVVVLLSFISFGTSSNFIQDIDDYTGKDVKGAYAELTGNEYEVEFVFDRNNNGGFTKDGFQEFVLNEIDSDSYKEDTLVITKQTNLGKKVTLYVDYASAVSADKEKEANEASLEEKLSIVESMTACERYGEQNYRDFKIHSILGKIAEYASDDDTWLLKYTVDADGYKDLTMECYVTGTTANPQVENFIVY